MKTEIAWAAGLFDGEGSIYMQDNRPVMKVGMTSRKTVERFARIIGKNHKIYVEAAGRRNTKWRAVYTWNLGRMSDVRAVLRLLLPYLVTKRVRAKRALRFLEQRITRKGYKWEDSIRGR